MPQSRPFSRAKSVIVMVYYDAGFAMFRVPEPIRAAVRAFEAPDVEA